MSVEEFTEDNLVTGTKKLITDNVLQLESGVVVRGEVLKKGTTGLVVLALTTDIPYCIALQNIDASGSAQPIEYSTDCSVLGSQLTFAAGVLADFRDGFKTSTNIAVEE